MIREQPNNFKYSLLYGGQEIEIPDPSGWDSLVFSLARGDYHGVNAEQSQDLQFAGDIHGLLRRIYSESGIYADVKLRVQIRLDDWTFTDYGIFQLDFSKYADDWRLVTQQVYEIGLRAKINTNLDTEYEIPLQSDSFQTLNYTSQKKYTSNVLQMLVGDDRIDIGNDLRILPGSRSVRAYDEDLQFESDGGTSTKFMMFKANKDIASLDLEVSIDRRSATDRLINPDYVDKHYAIVLVKRSKNGENTIIRGYHSSLLHPVLIQVYSSPQVVTITDLKEGDTIALAEKFSQSTLASYEGNVNTYLRVSKFALSGQNGKPLQVFTFDWLFESLLKTIDPRAEFVNKVKNNNIDHYLACSDTMRNIGNKVISGKIVCTLKDVIETYDFIECIGIDIKGNTFTVFPRERAYFNNTEPYEVQSTDLEIEHDNTHIYKSVKVSSKVGNNSEGNVSMYQDRTFSIDGMVLSAGEEAKELNLRCPYMIDPLAIDNKISELADNSSTGDDGTSEVAIFACEKVDNKRSYVYFDAFGGYNESVVQAGGGETEYPSDMYVYLKAKEDATEGERGVLQLTQRGDLDERFEELGFITKTFTRHSIATVKLSVSGRINGTNPSLTFRAIDVEITRVVKDEEAFDEEFFSYSRELELEVTANAGGQITFDFSFYTGESGLDYFLAASGSVDLGVSGTTLYRDQTILNYGGDPATVYNMPYTPKRIILKHLRYLAVSFVGNPTMILKHLSSSSSINVWSRLGYESDDSTWYVKESSDEDMSNVEPLFLPLTASFRTQAEYADLVAIRSNIYGSIATEREGKRLVGFVDSVVSSAGKEKAQEWVLMVKRYDI